LSRRRRRKLERGEAFQSGLKRDMDCDLCIYAGSLRPLGIHVEHVPAIFFSFSQVEREIVKKTIQRKKKKNKYKKKLTQANSVCSYPLYRYLFLFIFSAVYIGRERASGRGMQPGLYI
jgi:hypothetical protein